ncbi:hypothetical protein [Nitrospira sp. Nam80]
MAKDPNPERKEMKGMEKKDMPGRRAAPEETGGDGFPNEMLSGTAGQASTGSMPAPGMSESTRSGREMPTGHMREPGASAADMPMGSMGEPASHMGGMPTGGMGGGGSDAGRFPPSDASANPASAFLEPGLVEVEFREGIKPHVAPAAADAPSAIMSDMGANLSGLYEVLQRYRLDRAESTFQISAQSADAAQTTAHLQGVTVPNLANFVTLHFPAEADTQRIAHELAALPEVERAVAVPKAIPPQTPLNEPLIGTTDQVVLNPATGLENQWYIFRCRINQAWSMGSGNGVVIADIDWGYRTTHQDLAPRVVGQFEFNGEI